MSDESHPEHHKGFFDRMFHPGRLHKTEDQHQDQKHESQDNESQDNESQNKEGEFDRFKDYIKKDQQLEEEGDTYSGLM
ncbi:hypothetical protein BBP40_001611 [Aspergillus hancockii]|nr:hypothetical protein BBP40_001611 [Aspergillus hancockii]